MCNSIEFCTVTPSNWENRCIYRTPWSKKGTHRPLVWCMHTGLYKSQSRGQILTHLLVSLLGTSEILRSDFFFSERVIWYMIIATSLLQVSWLHSSPHIFGIVERKLFLTMWQCLFAESDAPQGHCTLLSLSHHWSCIDTCSSLTNMPSWYPVWCLEPTLHKFLVNKWMTEWKTIERHRMSRL